MVAAQGDTPRTLPDQQQQLWASFGLKGQLPSVFDDMIGEKARKRIRLGAEVGYRSTDAFFAGRQVYLDLEMRYKVSKLVDIGIEQRFAYLPDSKNRQRTGLKVMVSETFDRLTMADHELFFARVVEVAPGRLKEPPLLYSSRLGWRVTGDKAREPGTSIRDQLLERCFAGRLQCDHAREGVEVDLTDFVPVSQ